MCYWCSHYLDVLSQVIQGDSSDEVQVVARSTHGKYTNGWLCPPSVPSVTDKMLDYIGVRIAGIFNSLEEPGKNSESPAASSLLKVTSGESRNHNPAEAYEGKLLL